MSHVVTERCVDCKYTDCCVVCPSDSFYAVEAPAMLVIDPAVCIDCCLCVPECPVWAIYAPDEVPPEYRGWIKLNEELVPKGKPIKTKLSPLPTAVAIAAIHEREKGKGWKIADPSAAVLTPPAAVSGEKPKTAVEAKDLPNAQAKAQAPEPAPGSPPPPAPKIPAGSQASAPPSKAAPPPGAGPKAAPSGPKAAPASPSGGAPPPAPPTPKPSIPLGPLPPLPVRPGGRIRLGHRTGTVEAIRKGPGGYRIDARILFDGEEKPIWHVYSTLQTSKEKGDLEILDPGPEPGFLKRLLRRA